MYSSYKDTRDKLWYFNQDSSDCSIVIASSKLYARNLAGTFFPSILNDRQKEDTDKFIVDKLADNNFNKNFTRLAVKDIGDSSLPALEKKYLTGHTFSQQKNLQLFLSNDKSCALTINDNDHIHVAAWQPYLDHSIYSETALYLIERIENELLLEFDTRFGYITANPTMIGHGESIQYIMHLPHIMTENHSYLTDIAKSSPLVSIQPSSLFDHADIFFINFANTLGYDENEIKEEIVRVISRIVLWETKFIKSPTRKKGRKKEFNEIYKLLKNNNDLKTDDILNYLSKLRFAATLGLIDIDLGVITSIIFIIAGQNHFTSISTNQQSYHVNNIGNMDDDSGDNKSNYLVKRLLPYLYGEEN